MRIVKELVGKEVLGNDIMSMGKVVDVEVDLEDNFIESIIVSKGGIQESLNISKSELVIPFDMISKIGDKIILKDIFDEDLAQMEEEIEDLKSKL
ncbi:MAG: PRC-barrel domain-containing protein [Methanobrevibacter sp.]|nr:PRC-barrel domain-containing protein [Methanobrevibacter sp.]MBO5966011.1 PRC-barrel domain-containing protein [Methanobrevibacter sp.]MBO6105878.1 PRC-barrel domain-containing protein [Methanobrevibacter sp.]MBO7159635.1 PRC-barrel domain-containing protein [Methanobrevibacter sp.]MBO7210338.1 PRC-barrel domain-containing protein [Methanobrevibacter sp.]